MPLYTVRHCLICYKEDTSDSDSPESAALSMKTLNKNSEICKRFCTLASRYYDIDPFFFSPNKTLNSKRQFNIDRACEKCAERLLSFCEIYNSMQCLQMQLDWRAYEILDIMKQADKPNSSHALDRKALVEKLAKNEATTQNIDEFRGELKKSIAEKKAESFPQLKVKDQDPYFVRIKVKVKARKRYLAAKKKEISSDDGHHNQESSKKRPPSPPRLISNAFTEDLKASSNSGSVSKRKRRDSWSSTASEASSCSSTVSSYFEVVKNPKKKTIPPPRKEISSDEGNWSNEDKNHKSFSSSTSQGKVLEPIQSISEIIKSVPLVSENGGSSNSNNNNLGSGGGNSEKIENVHVDYHISSLNNLSVKCSSSNDNDNRDNTNVNNLSYYSFENQSAASWENLRKYLNLPQANYQDLNFEINENESITKNNHLPIPPITRKLMYMCPSPTCNGRFTTSTRAVIHQRATGHKGHPVVTLVRT